jgi:hypothetical protein
VEENRGPRYEFMQLLLPDFSQRHTKHMEKRLPLQQKLLGKLDICMQKTETRSISFTLYRYQLKWIKDINRRSETLKLMQERAANTLELIGTGSKFLNRTQMIQQLRERIDEWDYIKLKNLCTLK